MKRLISLALVFVMVFGLTIPSAWATEPTAEGMSATTTNGKYDADGTWSPVDGDGTITMTNERGLEVRLNKTAAPVAEDGNVFDVTLQVETTVTTKAAATVLVIDVSGSMDRCAECGADLGDYHASGCEHSGSGFFPDRVQDSQTRMAAARTAAISFLDRYKGDRENMGRYAAVVAFSTKGHVVHSWVDVSSPEGYAQAVSAVNELAAGGGTNLDDGLYQANELLQDAVVASVEREQKNVIALTDGVPTYHRHGGEGSKGSRATNRATAATAKELRENATVYTICFGASEERCYSNGPAVGYFLEQEIATPSGGEKQYAYSAKDTAELQQAFAEITQRVVSGANGSAWVVDDPMGDYVTVESAPDNVSVSEDRKELAWHLSDPTVTTEGGKTVYVYELTYRIRVDSNAEGFDETKFHPANGRTYLRGPTGNRVEFPVPGVKCALPYFTVTYQQGEHGSLQGQDAHGQVVHAPVKKGSPTPEAPAVTAEEGYYFTGWQPEVSPTVQDNVTYVAQYAPQKEIVVRANSASLLYNGEEQSVSGLEKTEFSIDGKTYTVEGLSAAAAGTTVGLYPVSITGTPVVMCDGRDVTHQFRVETEDGTLAIQKLPVTVTIHGNTDIREFTGKAQTVKGYTVAVENPLYAEKNIRFDGAAAARGTEVGTYAMGLRQEQFRNTDDNFAVTFLVNDGSLQITPVDAVVVTITGHRGTRLYDGAPTAVTGYDVTTSHKLYTEKDFAFAGTARSEGTDAGTYPMGLKAEDFKNTNPNFKNVVFQVSDGALEITPRKVELVSASGRKAYDGTPLVKEQVTVRGDGFVRGEGADYHDFAALTTVGKTQNDFQYTLRENTKAANYAITVVPGTLEITPHEGTVVITANSGSRTYDGTALNDPGYTVQGTLAQGDIVSAKTEGSATHVGDAGVNKVVSYQILRDGADVTNHYTNITTVDGKLEITKRAVVLTSGDAERAYDGTPLTAQTVEAEGFVAGEGATFHDFASLIDVGETANDFRYTLQTNTRADDYTITLHPGKLRVTANENAIVITANSSTKVYDGTALTDDGYTVDGALMDGDELTAVVKGHATNVADKGVNRVVSYRILRGDVDVTANYAGVTTVDGQLTITKRDVLLTSASESKQYDGTPLTAEAVTVSGSGFAEGEGASYHDFASLIDAGSTENTFRYTLQKNTDANNYAIRVVEGRLEILPVERELAITADSGSKTYDGHPLLRDGCTYTEGVLARGDRLLAVVQGSATNVSDEGINRVVSYRILRGDVDVTANYTNIATVDGTLSIAPRDVLLTSASDSKQYDGTPLTAEAVTVSGSGFAEGEGARYSHFASQTNVGRQENTFAYTLAENTLAENYHITVVNGWLSVTRHTQAKLTAEGYTGIYDGAAHDGVSSCQVTGGVDTDSWKYIYSLDSQTFFEMMPQFRDVGVYTVYVKAFNDNYGGDALVTPVTVEITPAQITLTADNQTRVTGETDPALTYQVQTPVADETPVFDGALVREPGESKGAYPIEQGTLRLTDGDGFRAANYTLHYVPGELTILQRALAVTKTVDRTKIQVGDKVTYTITVTNTGDVDLENVVLQDEMLSVQEELGRLACGASVTRTYPYDAVDGDAGKQLINTVVVTAEGGVREETDSEATDVQPKAPDTGDESGMALWLTGMLASAAGVFSLIHGRKRRTKQA